MRPKSDRERKKSPNTTLLRHSLNSQPHHQHQQHVATMRTQRFRPCIAVLCLCYVTRLTARARNKFAPTARSQDQQHAFVRSFMNRSDERIQTITRKMKRITYHLPPFRSPAANCFCLQHTAHSLLALSKNSTGSHHIKSSFNVHSNQLLLPSCTPPNTARCSVCTC